jgi:acetylornithine deacetylase/succinyl-diaminopimelate desuccinylase-like protein
MEQDTIDLLRDLVAIDSQNPSLVPGAAGEGEIAAYVADWATRGGLWPAPGRSWPPPRTSAADKRPARW